MNERSAMRHLANYAINKGFHISVWDGEEWSLTDCNDVEKIIEEVNGVDEAELRIKDLSKPEDKHYLGTAAVTAALDDEEDVYDYGINPFMDEWNDVFYAYIEKLDEQDED